VERNGLSRVLGIDYGERRVGLALSDPLKIIAKPYTVIDRKKNINYLEIISTIIDENKIESIVVGLPLTMRGEQSDQTKIVLSFIDELKNKFAIPILSIDERLSSQAAKKALHSQLIKTGHNKKRVDETAAAIFLQGYLDSNS